MEFVVNIIAIIQARMSSERLPGKVLMNLVNKPVLLHIVERLNYSKLISSIVVATSDNSEDNKIADLCSENKIKCFRGSLDDVLDRYYQAAKKYSADAVLRITGDCPAIDPEIVDKIISEYISGDYDCFGLGGKFPDGLDCTVYSFHALEKAWKEASLQSEREHVGPYIEQNKKKFKNGSLELFSESEEQRWTLDELEDYYLLSNVFEELYDPDTPFLAKDILYFLDKNPNIKKINSKIKRNEGYLKSLTREKHRHE